MGADENVAIMQRAYDAFNKADIDTLTEMGRVLVVGTEPTSLIARPTSSNA